MEKKFEFDYLRKWRTLSEDELSIISKEAESHEELRQLIELLGDENDKKEIISEKTFPELVYRMNNKMVDGSRKLGKAIIEAGDHRDEGKIADAIFVFQKFVQECPSEFYRKIARYYLTDLQN